MSVYTQLSHTQFVHFCQEFGLDFYGATPIVLGVKNSNWFIDTNQGEFVFTLFEERKPHEITKMANILNALKDTLPVACPLKTAQGDFVLQYNNKAILILPKLSGKHPSDDLGGITHFMCQQMGEALAKLHLQLQTLTPPEQYGVALYPWHLVKERECQFMPADEAKLMDDIWTAYAHLPKDLPSGLCHLDLFCDNTLWDFGDCPKLTGLLDFTEVSVETYLMDIAITLNDFCTTWGNANNGETVQFDHQKMTAFIHSYSQIRPLNDDEKKALPTMLAYSATIFWLLRLNVIYQNRQEGRTGENIMIKNPNLMKRLASLHWSNRHQYNEKMY